MKKVILFCLFIILSIGLMFLYEININSKLGYENLRNLRKVRLGMDSSEVIRIMGLPKSIIFKSKKEGLVFEYEEPSGLSTYCIIMVDSVGHVKYIHPDSMALDDLLGNVSK